jgi:hypothetical protein
MKLFDSGLHGESAAFVGVPGSKKLIVIFSAINIPAGKFGFTRLVESGREFDE